jgi:SAM-dependent methyltransferase
MPHGTAHDNSTNRLFNWKLNLLYAGRPLRILDIGCAGGGFVKSCLRDGHEAVGIEGSDYSRKRKRAEWRTIPNNLFTCDATSRFEFKTVESDGRARATHFDVITAWEFVEHIAEAQLPAVAANVDRHLAKNGLWILSVNTKEDVVNGVRLHQTVQTRDWWLGFFRSLDFQDHSGLVSYFGRDWVRGPLQNHGRGSFNLVLTRICDEARQVPAGSQAVALASFCRIANAVYRTYWLGRGTAGRLAALAGLRRQRLYGAQ